MNLVVGWRKGTRKKKKKRHSDFLFVSTFPQGTIKSVVIGKVRLMHIGT